MNTELREQLRIEVTKAYYFQTSFRGYSDSDLIREARHIAKHKNRGDYIKIESLLEQFNK